jgi:hypothetical protein
VAIDLAGSMHGGGRGGLVVQQPRWRSILVGSMRAASTMVVRRVQSVARAQVAIGFRRV